MSIRRPVPSGGRPWGSGRRGLTGAPRSRAGPSPRSGRLRELELDALKIDRTFVDGLPGDQKDRAIVDTVLTLARSLGMEVIAEGIETAEQLELLEELGCDQAQGFHLAVPLEPGELGSLLGDG